VEKSSKQQKALIQSLFFHQFCLLIVIMYNKKNLLALLETSSSSSYFLLFKVNKWIMFKHYNALAAAVSMLFKVSNKMHSIFFLFCVIS